MTSLFVLTSPRATKDPWEYLKATMRQVDDEGDLPCRKFIVVDAEQLAFEDLSVELGGTSWNLIRFERPASQQILGNKLPYWFLLERALEGGEDEVLALEDDLEFCRNATLRMLLLPVPLDVAWLQFYSGWTLTGPRMNPGLWRVPPTPVQGCQAIKYRRATLERLVAWSKLPEFTKFHESDVALGLAQQRLELRHACHCPDVVQHEGGISRVEEVVRANAGMMAEEDPRAALRGRQSLNYCGRDFDAMKLFTMHELFR